MVTRAWPPWGLMVSCLAGGLALGLLFVAIGLAGAGTLAGPIAGGALAWWRSVARGFGDRTAAMTGALVAVAGLLTAWALAVLAALSSIPPGFSDNC